MNNRGHKFGGNWTEQKLVCVSKYLHAYTKIMNKQPFHFAYIDAFTGTGYRETENDEGTDEIMFPDLQRGTPIAVKIAKDILEGMQNPSQLTFLG